MAIYNSITGRADLTDVVMPDQVVTEIIKGAPGSSIILDNARRTPMNKKKAKQPVLAKRPKAYWVDGDTGLKQTSDFGFEDLTMTAEEMAVIIPIPDAVVDDSDIPLWAEVKPLIAEAFGELLDQSAIFGTGKPASWPAGLVPAANTAGNVAQLSAEKDLGLAVAELGEKMAKTGVAPNSFIARPGLNWSLLGMRDKNGQHIYSAGNPITGVPSSLYGYKLQEVTNGAWNPKAAELLAVDWSKVFVGIRQDVTYDLFSEGVISDANGKVLLNLMQQDTKALRVVFRVGFQYAQPYSGLARKKVTPAGVITPAAA